MHQSSLGALMLIAPSKMHPLWYTPVLPLFFLMSAVSVGYPMVIVESMWAGRSFGRKPEMDVLTPLSRFTIVFLGLYWAAKIVDLLVRDKVGLAFEGTLESNMFLLEAFIGGVLPLALLMSRRARRNPALLFTAGLSVVLGVALNRMNVFMVAYHPPFSTGRYHPSIGEILVTIGMIAALAFVYRVAVTIFPVLPAHDSDAAEPGR